ECIGVQILNTGTQSKQYYYFQEDGLLTRIYNGDTTLFYCTEEEIKQQVQNFKKGKVSANKLPTLETAVHTSPDLPGAFNLKTLTVEISVKKRPHIDPPDFSTNHWQEVISREDVPDKEMVRYVLKLKDFDKSEATTAYPMESKPEFEEHLKATPLMQIEHPLVKETAMEIVKGETDARKAAQKIADYVYLNLSKGNSGVIGQYSAVEILQNKYGDCSEHCLLFTALCRAAGIPARRMSGLVCLGNLWGPHAWNEIWVGEWIGADPTTGDIGNVARYISAGYQDDPFSTIEAITKGFYGYATIRLLSASFGDGEEVDLTGKETLYGVTETHAFNYLSGISIQKKQADWKLTALPNRLVLRGDHISVDISVSPDQGNRHLDTGSYWMSGKVSYPEIQGVRCKMGEEVYSPKSSRKTIWAPAHRRIMTIRAELKGTPEEQAAIWQEFLSAFNLYSWKKSPESTSNEIQPKTPEEPK
ncbi:MAG: transglutaminase-like domain-containing protein, partial [Planctomycetota bacterium]